MQKLARTDAAARKTMTPSVFDPLYYSVQSLRKFFHCSVRPNIPEAKTRNIALKNMFDPAEYVSNSLGIFGSMC